MTDEKFREIKNANDKKPYIKEMIGMMQDLNWTYANECLHMLQDYQEEAIPLVKDILKSNDSQWKYFTLKNFVKNWTLENFIAIEEEIITVAKYTDYWEQNDLISIELICKFLGINKFGIVQLLKDKYEAVKKELMAISINNKTEYRNSEKLRLEKIKNGNITEVVHNFLTLDKQFQAEMCRFGFLLDYKSEIEEIFKRNKIHLTTASSG